MNTAPIFEASEASEASNATERRSGRARPGRWKIRDARSRDLPGIREILTSLRLSLEGLEDQFGEGYVVVEADGKLVGVAGLEVYGRYGLLRSLAVLPEWQGARVGKALVLDRLYWARSEGLLSVFLLTMTPRYFERLGFKRVDRNTTPPEVRFSKEFSSVCPETATALAIPINGEYVERRNEVRSRYAAIARALEGQPTRERPQRKGEPAKPSSCCGPSCCGSEETSNVVTRDLYTHDEVAAIPEPALKASLGCGNPTALADLHEGEIVLDLGSGGGIDVLLSAKRVGTTGKVYGLDMTDEMLALARENQRKAGVTNVEFLKGEIESIPLPDNSVDVVISNCVINLSTDKKRALAEAFRVLRPGGRFAVSDVVARGPVPKEIRRNVEMWVGCIAGTLEEREYRSFLADAGFDGIEVVPTRIYGGGELCGLPGVEFEGDPAALDGLFMSAFVRAKKPSA